jgi:type II secretory pathway component PulM
MISALRERYGQLTPQERVVVLILGAALLLVALWLGVWRPASAAWRGLELQVANQRADLEAMRGMVARLQSAGPAHASGNLLGAAERSAREAGFGTGLTRLAQADDGRVEAQLEGVAFDALAVWLADLARHEGAQLVTLEIQRHATPGRVDALVTLAP